MRMNQHQQLQIVREVGGGFNFFDIVELSDLFNDFPFLIYHAAVFGFGGIKNGQAADDTERRFGLEKFKNL